MSHLSTAKNKGLVILLYFVIAILVIGFVSYCLVCCANPKKFHLKIISNDESMGYVYGEGDYAGGKIVELSASRLAGYDFISWEEQEEDDTKKEISKLTYFKYTMPYRDVTIYANFDAHAYEVKVTVNMYCNVEGAGFYKYGSQVVLRCVSFEGYENLSWLANGEAVQQQNEFYTFTMPNEDVEIQCQSTKKKYLFDVYWNKDLGTVTTDKSTTMLEGGTVVYLNAIPNTSAQEGYKVVFSGYYEWIDGDFGKLLSPKPNYFYTTPYNNSQIYALFEEVPI